MKRRLEIPKSKQTLAAKHPEQDTQAHNVSKILSTQDIFGPLSEIPVFKGNNESRNYKLRGKYTIYTINTLSDLIGEARQTSKKDRITLRFLLTPKFELLFAREGTPNAHIPAHFAMTGTSQETARCITAGNIKIDSAGNIVHISHQSGDFKPSLDSLQYALFALFACDVPFSETVTIEKHEKNCVKLNVTLKNLQNEINEKFSDSLKKEYQNVNNSLVTQIREYPLKNHFDMKDNNLFFTDIRKLASSEKHPSKIRKILFEDDVLETNLCFIKNNPFDS